MSDNLLVINILVIIFYLLVEKLRIDEDIKKMDSLSIKNNICYFGSS